ncbi:hypothetical protein QVD17_02471 [Tagetes erecta]|uniref:Uncharacterized protein n=1 Tax=Tagetes erecta TaxID=13708 RepID=A0AAD8L9F9_TARER|nr:hypothetical protein QVD17_02471 [Tagetes erecta]
MTLEHSQPAHDPSITIHFLSLPDFDFCTKAKAYNCRFDIMSMNWAQRKIYLYNVTFGLYMLDPWERYLFNALVVVLMWFIFYNGYRNLNEICKRYIW